MEIQRLGPDEVDRVLAASHLFDHLARPGWTTTFLTSALADLAVARGCYGMWVSTEADNIAALATYRSAGASDPDPGVILTWTFD